MEYGGGMNKELRHRGQPQGINRGGKGRWEVNVESGSKYPRERIKGMEEQPGVMVSLEIGIRLVGNKVFKIRQTINH